jgi:hypothetical protein
MAASRSESLASLRIGHQSYKDHEMSSVLAALLASAVHTTAYLAVTGLIAWVSIASSASRFFGWPLNLNLIWGAALVVTSVLTLLI